jgi:hypothetical protein
LNIILLLISLQAFCLFAGFGIAYSLLKKTSHQHLSILLAPIIFPVSLVLLISLGGYYSPRQLPSHVSILLSIPLLICSAIVVWRDRATLLAAHRSFGPPVCVLILSTFLALPSVAPDIVNRSLTYIDIGQNDELLNYSGVAGHLLGRTIHGAYAADYERLTLIRGEVLLAVLADAVDAPPANCLYLLIALFRALAIAAFGFFLLRSTNSEIANRPWLLYSGVALFSFSSLEVANYSVSFLSHYEVASVVILLVSLLLFQEDASDPRIFGLRSALYLYLYFSYSEIVAIPIFIQTIQVLQLAFRARSVRLCFFGLAPPAFAAALNPTLVAQRLHWLIALSKTSSAGFVMFVTPRESVIGYFATILGLRFPAFSLNVVSDRYAETAITVFLLACLLVSCWLIWRYQRQYWIVAGAIILLGATFIAWSSDPATQTPSIYRADKSLIYANFLLIGAIVLAVFEPLRQKFLRYLVLTGYMLFLLTSFRLSAEVASRLGSWRKVYPLTDVSAAVRSLGPNVPIALPSGDAISSMYWNQILQYYGFADRYGDKSTLMQNLTLWDSAGEPTLLRPVPAGQKGALISNTIANFWGVGGQTIALTPEYGSATLRYRGGAFDVYSDAFQSNPNVIVLTCEVVFPATIAMPEPLLTGGVEANGFFLFIRYPEDKMAQFGYAQWGSPTVWGNPFSIQDGRAEQLRVRLDSDHNSAEVSIGNNVVLRREGPVPVFHLINLTVGENRIGGTVAGARFSGRISNVKIERR